MPEADGDGWVRCGCGRRHWGRFGAAGLVIVRKDAGGGRRVLLQHRSAQVHDGGTWAVPGGARDSHEDVVAAALREAREEVGVTGEQLDVLACVPGTDHGCWSYVYVIAVAVSDPRPRAETFETAALAWVDMSAPVPAGMVLHPALAADWPDLTAVARAVVPDGVVAG
jgi:8-oxo-dGTP diphosphatase